MTIASMERDSAPEQRTVDVPYSEVAMHCGIAGMTLEAVEEATYVNGRTIPREQRHGCYVITASGARLPMLKSEAGWRDVT